MRDLLLVKDNILWPVELLKETITYLFSWFSKGTRLIPFNSLNWKSLPILSYLAVALSCNSSGVHTSSFTLGSGDVGASLGYNSLNVMSLTVADALFIYSSSSPTLKAFLIS
jgi:hypothetical protein